MTRLVRMLAAPDTAFAAFNALYPPCNIRLDEDTVLLAAPRQIRHGAAAIITRADACRHYVERLRKAGRDAAFLEYADALHGCDNPPGLEPVLRAAEPSRCTFEQRAEGILVNAGTGWPVTLGDPCISPRMSGGRNAQVATAKQAGVKAFLATVFKRAK